MEKRMMLAFALTFLVIIASQQLMQRYGPKKAEQKPAITSGAPETQTTAAGGNSGAAKVSADQGQQQKPVKGPAARTANAAAAIPTKQSEAESETVIESDLYRVTFSNRGAMVKSWILKKYRDDNGKPLELVNKIAAEKYGYPLQLFTYDAELRGKVNTALYVASASGEQKAPATVTFEFSDGQTIARKSFGFDESYVMKVEAEVSDGGKRVTSLVAWPAGFGDQTVPASYAAGKIEWQRAEKIERRVAKKVGGGESIPGPFHWAATADQYFAAAFLPDDPANAQLVTFHGELQVPQDLNKATAKMQPVQVLGAAVGNSAGITAQRLYVGPKAMEILQKVNASLGKDGAASPEMKGPGLEGLVDFGFFSFIAKPLFLWLKWTQEHWIPNWGWAIAFLTIVINLAVLPLRITSMKSALKMQRIQPEIKNIQEKYKKYGLTDPRKADMNKEVQAIYKREGVNPLGGCLPLVLQMPFLIAFYTMLGATTELRQAPWMWVRDLSAPDPWHVLPVMIIISMYVLQKMTPQPGVDAVQAKMMSFMMPVMLGVISWSLAAGLGIYWTLGNLISLAQQAVMNRTSLGRDMRAALYKKSGAPRTLRGVK